ncbi:MAG: KOW domain-containing RNA-binding protein [Clostridia bacterium]
MNRFKVGMVAESVAGRDKGSFYVVKEVKDENYVFVCDGNRKTLIKPKKKNAKHLKVLDIKYEVFVDKSTANMLLLNAEIKKFLKILKKS